MIAALKQQIQIFNGLGVKGPPLAKSLAFLANAFVSSGNINDALGSSEMAVKELMSGSDLERTGADVGAVVSYGKKRSPRYIHETRVAVLIAAAANEKSHSESELGYLNRACEEAQSAHQSSVAKAMNDVGARLAAGTDNFAALLRRRQDLVADLTERQSAFSNIVAQNTAASLARGKAHVTRLRDVSEGLSSAPDPDSSHLDKRIEETRSALAANDAELRKFPKFAGYVDPAPIPDKDLARLLNPGEALLVTLVTGEATYLWLITPETSAFRIDHNSTSADLSGHVRCFTALFGRKSRRFASPSFEALRA